MRSKESCRDSSQIMDIFEECVAARLNLVRSKSAEHLGLVTMLILEGSRGRYKISYIWVWVNLMIHWRINNTDQIQQKVRPKAEKLLLRNNNCSAYHIFNQAGAEANE